MNTREAVVRLVKDLTFVGKAGSNHWIPVDSSHKGNVPGATSPMELVLIALGSCTGSDVAIILEKKRAHMTEFEITIKAERATQDPKVYTSIHLEYIVTGIKMRETDVAHAIDLSMTKYCSVSAMLKKSVDVTYSFRILEAGSATG
ncbi:MAG TPA: OsmC family protein [Bacteroidota bacterium]|nr:OsmC family protein [Bacteroidota bacterium]